MKELTLEQLKHYIEQAKSQNTIVFYDDGEVGCFQTITGVESYHSVADMKRIVELMEEVEQLKADDPFKWLANQNSPTFEGNIIGHQHFNRVLTPDECQNLAAQWWGTSTIETNQRVKYCESNGWVLLGDES